MTIAGISWSSRARTGTLDHPKFGIMLPEIDDSAYLVSNARAQIELLGRRAQVLLVRPVRRLALVFALGLVGCGGSIEHGSRAAESTGGTDSNVGAAAAGSLV